MKRIVSLLLSVLILLSALSCLTVFTASAATTSQNNIVDRAEYLWDSTWVCQQDVYGWRSQNLFTKGNTYRIPYGQPVYSGYYVGYGVSVDNYLKAANTAGSIFYTSRSNYSGWYSTYYATDCSAFVAWSWGTDRKTTYSIPFVSTNLGYANVTNIQKLQLGDCLNSNGVGHVVLCTGLTYDESGAIVGIEITEQTPPQLKRTQHTPATLAATYGAYYTIQRYTGTVPSAPASSNSSSTTATTATTAATTSATDGMYYPACASSYTSLYAAFSSIGVTCNWNLQCRIAEKNGITNFTGIVAQNTTMLNLLKQGKLLNPDYVAPATAATTATTETTVVTEPSEVTTETTVATTTTPTTTPTTAATTQATTAAPTTEATEATTEDPDKYYPACASSYDGFYAAMNSIGVSVNWTLHCRIAAKNGITNFTGSAAQNTQLLNLLKQGKLLNPDYVAPTTAATTAPTTAAPTTAATTAPKTQATTVAPTTKETTAATTAPTTQATTAAPTTAETEPTEAPSVATEPTEDPNKYYPAADSSYVTLYSAMRSIGVSLNWNLQVKIAKANNIPNYSGTVAQNQQILDLLWEGKLIDPDYVAPATTAPTTAATTAAPTTAATTQPTTAATTAAPTTATTEAPTTQATEPATEATQPETESKPSVVYYPACDSSAVTLYSAMRSVGVSLTWNLQVRIAAANNIANYTGTTAQNQLILDLLRAGKLINPDGVPASDSTSSNVSYYAKCDSSQTSLISALNSVGVASVTWTLQKQIAAANGITNYTGTAAQNIQLLNLLKQGKLIKP